MVHSLTSVVFSQAFSASVNIRRDQFWLLAMACSISGSSGGGTITRKGWLTFWFGPALEALWRGKATWSVFVLTTTCWIKQWPTNKLAPVWWSNKSSCTCDTFISIKQFFFLCLTLFYVQHCCNNLLCYSSPMTGLHVQVMAKSFTADPTQRFDITALIVTMIPGR